MLLRLPRELRSTATAPSQPGGTATDRISVELIEQEAQTIAVLQRAPLPATIVTDLLPACRTAGLWRTMAPRQSLEPSALKELAATPPKPPRSWDKAPHGYSYRAMDSDRHWNWFKERPYGETLFDYDGWDADEGIRQERGSVFYPGLAETLEE
ncbi:TPA: hypothetical protein QEL68_002115 [Stenotrophomonas maltophilia]|nr:hypothetical protein [Stenotrophomonas maltophilia]HDS1650393.1 hypothetical protein [Stenotrophomonas maltophilia]